MKNGIEGVREKAGLIWRLLYESSRGIMAAWISIIVVIISGSPFGGMFLQILLMDWIGGARGVWITLRFQA